MFIFSFEGVVVVPVKGNSKTQPSFVAREILEKEGFIATCSVPFKGNEEEGFFRPMLESNELPKFGIILIGYLENQFRA